MPRLLGRPRLRAPAPAAASFLTHTPWAHRQGTLDPGSLRVPRAWHRRRCRHSARSLHAHLLPPFGRHALRSAQRDLRHEMRARSRGACRDVCTERAGGNAAAGMRTLRPARGPHLLGSPLAKGPRGRMRSRPEKRNGLWTGAWRPTTLASPRRRYLRCLTSVEVRFPISKEKGHASVAFSWNDAFTPKKKTTQHNVHFEKAAVLFNAASITSQMALANDRTTGEGLKAACAGFQVGRTHCDVRARHVSMTCGQWPMQTAWGWQSAMSHALDVRDAWPCRALRGSEVETVHSHNQRTICPPACPFSLLCPSHPPHTLAGGVWPVRLGARPRVQQDRLAASDRLHGRGADRA
eukprot:359601-Chlamydomonas_euryale.AAC.3